MISENNINKVYFSKWLKKDHPIVFKQIEEKLLKHKQAFELLENTNDYWARDFMPIQVSKDKFVQYNYFPDYLSKKQKFITDTPSVLKALNFKAQIEKTELIIDGGNIVKSENAVILTDKIFVENKNRSKEDIVQELKEKFELEKVVIIPWDKKNDKLGHSDGMLRFIEKDMVLINGYYKSSYYSDAFQKALFGALEQNDIDYKELKFKDDLNYKTNWAYINFLQTKGVILIPKFNLVEDEEALKQIKDCFPNYKIEQIEMKDFVEKGGGALNCISWTIEI